MNYNTGTPLQSGTSDQTLANESVHFFKFKVQKIRLGLDVSDLMTIQLLQTWMNRYQNLVP